MQLGGIRERSRMEKYLLFVQHKHKFCGIKRARVFGMQKITRTYCECELEESVMRPSFLYASRL